MLDVNVNRHNIVQINGVLTIEEDVRWNSDTICVEIHLYAYVLTFTALYVNQHKMRQISGVAFALTVIS